MQTAIYRLLGIAAVFVVGILCGLALGATVGESARVNLPGAPGFAAGIARRARRRRTQESRPGAGLAELTDEGEAWDTYGSEPDADDIENAG